MKPREFWIQSRVIGDDTYESVLRYSRDSDKNGCIHVIEFDTYDQLTQALREACAALELIRDIPGLGGMDYASVKKWREGSMKSIDHHARTTLTSIYAKFPELAKTALAKDGSDNE